MKEEYSRTAMLLGEASVKKLQQSHIIIFGLGGVGSYAAEALARVGVGRLTLVDGDKISLSNINRQLYALNSTIGMDKAFVAKKRCADINPLAEINAVKENISRENINDIITDNYDFIIDAIDDVDAKVSLIKYAYEKNIPVITSMGMGNKTDISKISLSYIEKTHTCPLARVMRKKLKDEGIKKVMCVFSSEEPKVNLPKPSSVVFVPAAAGLMMAQYVIMSLAEMA
jgi:tRNA A37 threonylcarbamoyladenosine dehydratase